MSDAERAKTIPVVECPVWQALTALHKIPERTLAGPPPGIRYGAGWGHSYSAPLHGHAHED
jgi:hypothetical protein